MHGRSVAILFAGVLVFLGALLQVAQAGPLRLATSYFAPPGETGIRFVDATTLTDGSLCVLTYGLAGAQPRLRLTRYDNTGLRTWSRTIQIPSPVEETGENLKQASLLALPAGRVLLLSQRPGPADAPGVKTDIVARIFNPAGEILANRGLAPIVSLADRMGVNFTSAQGVVDRDGLLWIAATGREIRDGKASSGQFCFDTSMVLKGFRMDYGWLDGWTEGSYLFLQDSLLKGNGIAPGPNGGITVAVNGISRTYYGSEDMTYLADFVLFWECKLSGGRIIQKKFVERPAYSSVRGNTIDAQPNFHKGFDGATSADVSLLTLTCAVEDNLPMNCSLAVNDNGIGDVRYWQAMKPSDTYGLEPLPNGDFLFVTPRAETEPGITLDWRRRVIDPSSTPSNVLESYGSLVLPTAPLGTPWIISGLRTAPNGVAYLAGGPAVGGKESLGIYAATFTGPAGPVSTVIWQLTQAAGSFGAKALLPTVEDKVFAVGLTENGEIAMQLFQEPTYFRGIQIPSTMLKRGTTGRFRLLFGSPAPAGGYTVRLSFPSGTFKGLPTSVIVPGGSRFYEAEFEVLPTAPVGPVTVVSRGDALVDNVTPAHTSTFDIR